jgi:hypothetical protein
MSIYKDIEDLLSQVRPEPLRLDQLAEMFVKHVVDTQTDGTPICIKKYRECLITSGKAFVKFMKADNRSYLDEVTVGVLWEFRYAVESQFKPRQTIAYMIALKSFLRWCYFSYYLDSDVSEALYIIKDNRRDRHYGQAMDPCGFNLDEIY